MNVLDTATLTILDSTRIYLTGDCEIFISENSNLIIGDNVTFTGKRGNNKLIINGDIEIGRNVSFNNIHEIKLNNYNLQTTFNNATFSDTTILVNYGQEITIDSSSFNGCFMAYFHHCDIEISNTDFNNTGIYIYNPWDSISYSAAINDCEFNNTIYNTISAIEIMAYDEFYIENNTISGYDAGTQKGIELWYSGNGTPGNQIVRTNTIYDNTTSILLYNTIASVLGNNIYNNDYGIKFESRTNAEFSGDSITGIQYIKDNEYYEVYASENSFPWYFKFNEIVDNDNAGNPEDPLIYHNVDTSGGMAVLDVRYNCWGDTSSFNPSDDFYPVNHYNYIPIYCQSTKSFPNPGPDEILYNDALDEFEAGNYSNSKSLYKSLIEQYNESPYSIAAVKDMFALEQFATNNYDELKSYYRTNDSIKADSSLAKLADFMANKCDVKLENWLTAIDWYENEIQNPQSYEDSIYAVIDLGYLYLQIDTTDLKSINGSIPEHKPDSWAEYIKKRDYLLSLIPGDDENNKENTFRHEAKSGRLFQNIPNPFSNTTRITYKLFINGRVSFEIYDYTGKRLKTYNLGYMEKGKYTFEMPGEFLVPGVYFYSLKINNNISDTKKMSVL